MPTSREEKIKNEWMVTEYRSNTTVADQHERNRLRWFNHIEIMEVD